MDHVKVTNRLLVVIVLILLFLLYDAKTELQTCNEAVSVMFEELNRSDDPKEQSRFQIPRIYQKDI
jgi:hypothetical protein